MRRITLIIAAAVAFGLAACAHQSVNQKEEKKMKTLVAYFSATGTTERVAKMLAEVAGADLYRIEPETPYTAADLDWNDKNSRSTLEMHDPKSRPAIKGRCERMADYDIVYIGFPIWWYTVPSIINTFMESYDLRGKTLIPFATSGGTEITKTAENLRKTYPDLNWKPGRLLNGATHETLEAFVKGR